MQYRIHTVDKDPEVREKSQDVRESEITSGELTPFFDALISAMLEADGIGIASPQVGVTKRIIVVSKEYTSSEDHLILVNPRIASTGSRVSTVEEGCLSVPGKNGLVERPVKARIKALGRTGKPVDIKAKGMFARILQHEIDHLDGILFIDRASSVYEATQTGNFV
ncbi:MAG: peptide deformylase [Candidatus Kerfeldbacteria bacterium]